MPTTEVAMATKDSIRAAYLSPVQVAPPNPVDQMASLPSAVLVRRLLDEASLYNDHGPRGMPSLSIIPRTSSL